MQGRFLVILALAAISCAGQEPQRRPAPAPPPPGGPAASAETAKPPLEPAPPPTAMPDALDAGPADAPSQALEAVDLNAWLDERAVSQAERKKLPYIYMLCERRTVGDKGEEALDCQAIEHVERGHGSARVYRVRTRRTIYVVRKGRITVALDVVESVTPLDKEELSQPNIVDLEVTLAPDGRAARLGDPPPSPPSELRTLVPCDKALPELLARSRRPDATAWDRFDLELARKACADRGSFTWKAGRFERAAREP